VSAWDSKEHQELGTESITKACELFHTNLTQSGTKLNNQQQHIIDRACNDITFQVYGRAVALAGDYSETPQDLINNSILSFPKYLEKYDDWNTALDEYIKESEQWKFAHLKMFLSFQFKVKEFADDINALVDYWNLASNNNSHFHPMAPKEWSRHHQQALLLAEKVKLGESTDIWEGLYTQAFSDHFLQDSFSAGHIGMARGDMAPGDALLQHNHLNELGLFVQNERGDEWYTFGDHYLDKFVYATENNYLYSPTLLFKSQNEQELFDGLKISEDTILAGPFRKNIFVSNTDINTSCDHTKLSAEYCASKSRHYLTSAGTASVLEFLNELVYENSDSLNVNLSLPRYYRAPKRSLAFHLISKKTIGDTTVNQDTQMTFSAVNIDRDFQSIESNRISGSLFGFGLAIPVIEDSKDNDFNSGQLMIKGIGEDLYSNLRVGGAVSVKFTGVNEADFAVFKDFRTGLEAGTYLLKLSNIPVTVSWMTGAGIAVSGRGNSTSYDDYYSMFRFDLKLNVNPYIGVGYGKFDKRAGEDDLEGIYLETGIFFSEFRLNPINNKQ